MADETAVSTAAGWSTPSGGHRGERFYADLAMTVLRARRSAEELTVFRAWIAAPGGAPCEDRRRALGRVMRKLAEQSCGNHDFWGRLGPTGFAVAVRSAPEAAAALGAAWARSPEVAAFAADCDRAGLRLATAETALSDDDLDVHDLIDRLR